MAWNKLNEKSSKTTDEKSIFKEYEDIIHSLDKLRILLDPTPSGTGKTRKMLAPKHLKNELETVNIDNS